jgi:hypoxia up-regulated 1
MAIDLGGEFMKVVLVQPGRTPVVIVPNEMSKRKTPALVAFHHGERLLGEEASAITGRVPGRVYGHMRDSLGQPAGEGSRIRTMFEEAFLPYDSHVDSERGTLRLTTHHGKDYSVEEMVANLLHYCHRIAKDAAGGPVFEAVITVPPFFGQSHRKALIAAAEASGIKLLSLVHTYSAAALQYGIEKDFSNKTENVILFDMGATSTEATLVSYTSSQASTGNTLRGQTAVGQFRVRDVQWNDQAGVAGLETVLARHFAEEFKEKHGVDLTVLPKAMAKLKKACKKTKEVLSANTEAGISVTSIHDDVDFVSHITREKFEELAGDLFARAAEPLQRLVTTNNLTMDDISAVELLGGGTRVPRMQSYLSEVLGGRDLDRHLDSDEATVMGAGLFAANLSTAFRMRQFGMTDGSPFEIECVLQPQLLDESAGEPEVRQLIPRMKRLPIRRSVSIPDFEGESLLLTTRYSASGPLPPGIVENKIASYQVTGVKDTLNAYNVTSGKLAVVFHMGVDGILEIERADIAVSWNGTVIEKVLDVDPPATPEETEDKPEAPEGEAAAEEGTTGEENATSADAEKENADPKEKPVNSMKFKQVEIVKPMTAKPRLNHTVVWEHVPSLKTADVFKMTDSLLELRQADKAKKENEEAKNGLESWVIDTRARLNDEEEVEQVSTEGWREKFKETLEEAEDWLYEGGEGGGANANKTQFNSKLGELRDQFRAVGYRADELKKRPTVVEDARKFLSETSELLELWTTTKPWLPESGKAGLIATIEAFNVTLEKWVAEQEETSLFSDPVFGTYEVTAKIKPMMERLERLKKQKEPKKKAEPKKAAAANATAEAEVEADTQQVETGSSGDAGDEGKGGEGAAEGQAQEGAATVEGQADEGQGSAMDAELK